MNIELKQEFDSLVELEETFSVMKRHITNSVKTILESIICKAQGDEIVLNKRHFVAVNIPAGSSKSGRQVCTLVNKLYMSDEIYFDCDDGNGISINVLSTEDIISVAFTVVIAYNDMKKKVDEEVFLSQDEVTEIQSALLNITDIANENKGVQKELKKELESIKKHIPNPCL